ncbi:hypothetical protein G6F62_015425 [Rhizopus arrhizus]|nr:hypothetical protein G6F62_015425 [Rhizopus arrhizus]
MAAVIVQKRGSASRSLGSPCSCRKAGAAHTTRRTCPTGTAVKVESGKAPMRTATSTPSSSRFTTRSTSKVRTDTSRCARR